MDGVALSDTPPKTVNSGGVLDLLELRRQVGLCMQSSTNGWHRVVRNRDPVTVLDTRSCINRATLKLREMAPLIQSTPQRIALLAEAPGGFLQACKWLWPSATCIGTSLGGDGAIEFDDRVRYAVLDNLPHEGDICFRKTADAIVEHIGAASCDLVTADGGAEAKNLDLAEQESTRLVIAQIALALRLQRTGGFMVVKIFEGSTDATRDLFHILLTLYEEVHLVKPKTSRCANSERYIVCCRYLEGQKYDAEQLAVIVEELRAGRWLCRLCTTRNQRVDEAFEALAREQCKGIESVLRAFRSRNETEILQKQKSEAAWLIEKIGVTLFQRKRKAL